MTATGAGGQPPSRALASWYTALVGRRPLRLWFAHLPVLRVEALVECSRPHPLDPLRRAALGRISAGLGADVGEECQVINRLLRILNAEGLTVGRGRSQSLSAVGAEALRRGEWHERWEERREFAFIPGAVPGGPPTYVPLRPCQSRRELSESPAVCLADLEGCAKKPAAWKAMRRFPAEVTGVRLTLPEETGPDAWRRVVVERSERVELLFAEVPVGGAETGLLGLPVDPESWKLDVSPVLALGAAWPETFPDLHAPPDPVAWRHALEEWARRRGLTDGELDGSRLNVEGLRVRVELPSGTLGRECFNPATLLQADSWVLAGEGRARAAGTIEFVSLRND